MNPARVVVVVVVVVVSSLPRRPSRSCRFIFLLLSVPRRDRSTTIS
jgi:hypothetical protein